MIEGDRQEGMGDRGEDMQQRTTGRNQTRVAVIRSVPYGNGTHPSGSPININSNTIQIQTNRKLLVTITD